MAMKKIVTVDKIEVINDFNIQVRTVTKVVENNIVVGGKKYTRHVLNPDSDLTNEDPRVKKVAIGLFDEENKAAWLLDKGTGGGTEPVETNNSNEGEVNNGEDNSGNGESEGEDSGGAEGNSDDSADSSDGESASSESSSDDSDESAGGSGSDDSDDSEEGNGGDDSGGSEDESSGDGK